MSAVFRWRTHPKPSLSSLNLIPHPSNEWYKLILIGIYTGLRLGDCCQLDWSCISIPNGVIQLIPQKTRRHAHGKPVTIPIHQTLGAALLDRGTGNGEQGMVGSSVPSSQFPVTLSGPVLPTLAEMYRNTRWRVSDGLGRIFRAANISMSVQIEGRRTKTPEATFHSLRHTFVSFAANAGVPLHIVQSIVGHESTAMTRHYYHENIAALKSAVAAIPTL